MTLLPLLLCKFAFFHMIGGKGSCREAMLQTIIMSPGKLQGDKTYSPEVTENPKTQSWFRRDKATLGGSELPSSGNIQTQAVWPPVRPSVGFLLEGKLAWPASMTLLNSWFPKKLTLTWTALTQAHWLKKGCLEPKGWPGSWCSFLEPHHKGNIKHLRTTWLHLKQLATTPWHSKKAAESTFTSSFCILLERL